MACPAPFGNHAEDSLEEYSAAVWADTFVFEDCARECCLYFDAEAVVVAKVVVAAAAGFDFAHDGCGVAGALPYDAEVDSANAPAGSCWYVVTFSTFDCPLHTLLTLAMRLNVYVID